MFRLLIPGTCTLLLTATTTVGLHLPVRGQERDAVLATVQAMFDGMRTKDSVKMRAAFDPAGRLVGVGRDQEGNVRVSANTVDGFVAAIMRAGGEVDERIYDPEVRIDGSLAAVWTSYDLVVGGQFIHCGVDAFQLSKVGERWKITQVADTRHPQGCTTPRAPK